MLARIASMSDLLDRAKAALRSGQASKRAAHFVLGKALAALPAATRRALFGGTLYHCPLCEVSLRSFLRLYRDFYKFCPVCWSLPRHRLVWLFIRRRTDLLTRPSTRLPHIAPEPSLSAYFQRLENVRYLSADLHNPQAMVKMDVCDIRYPDGAFDAIYCSHVLEHVPDDHKAMSELRRVLNPEGWALILLPITAEQTYEDVTVTDPAERERRFGQHDHVRRYGPDCVQRLESAGFNVTTVWTEDVATPAEIERLCLAPHEPLFYCTISR